MTTRSPDPERRNPFQRHVERIIAALVVAALTFVGTALYDMSGTLRVVLNRLDTLDTRFSSIDARFQLYQTKESARAAWEAQALRDQMTHSRIDQVQNSLKMYQPRVRDDDEN